MSNNIQQKIISLIARHKGLDPKTITPISKLSELGISSLDAITILYELEDELGIQIPNEQLEFLRTVEDIITALESLMQDTDKR